MSGNGSRATLLHRQEPVRYLPHIRRGLLLALLPVLGVAPAAAQAPPDELRCLDLSVGPWSGGAGLGADSIYLRPPPRVRLLPRPDAVDGPALLVREVEGSVPSVHEYSGWRLSPARDTLHLGWSTGFSGFDGALLREGEGYRGRVETFTDFVGQPSESAELAAVPVDCAAPLPPGAAALRPIPRGIRLQSGDSVRLGMPLAAVEEVAPRPGYRMVYLLAPLAALFAGAADVELLPDRPGAVAIIRFALPPGADFDALVRTLAEEYGPPVSRAPHPSTAAPGETAAWSNRESNFVLSRYRQPDGTDVVRALLSLHRIMH